MRYLVPVFLFIAVGWSFYAYKIYKSALTEPEPVELNKTHICANDSMILLNHDGPKAQIVWKDNSRTFYCEVKEAFYDCLHETKKRRVIAFFVQDFSGLEWGSYTDNWMTASNAYYVIDSSKNGAMGITYVPFSDKQSAKEFHKLHGGKIVTVDFIDLDALSASDAKLRSRQMF